jgi:hypothetical protein
MDAKEFIRELVRMCQAQGEICGDCRIHREIGCPLVVPERVDADKLVSAVEKWSKANPHITNGHKLLSELKNSGANVRYTSSGVYNAHIRLEIPAEWWDAEYEGEE